MNTVKMAKLLMKKFESFPISPEIEIRQLEETFNHSIFLDGSEADREKIMLKSSRASYSSEVEHPWDQYFGINLSPLLHRKVVLDLGSFNGGRSVAWFERYGLEYIVGVDVDQIYIDVATRFAAMKRIRADYKLARGESLPFEDETFDAVLSFEVFEHIRDVQRTLDECYRVLRTGGRLFVVFPGYFQPFSHHLSLVAKCPGIQYLFSGETLVKAYFEILEERGSEAYWYKRSTPYLEPWERGNTINGTTFAQFHKIIRNGNWKVVMQGRKPIGSIGRRVSKKRISRFVSQCFYPLTFLPYIQEIFLHRIVFILEKE